MEAMQSRAGIWWDLQKRRNASHDRDPAWNVNLVIMALWQITIEKWRTGLAARKKWARQKSQNDHTPAVCRKWSTEKGKDKTFPGIAKAKSADYRWNGLS